jgi:threonylcarbamoyladenosine tRNA methylthiotransferase MtaB
MAAFHNITGKTFSVITLGCRVNHYESEAIASMLEGRGAVFIPYERRSADTPDIVALLTCSITSAADSKTRKTLRRVRRENPSSLIIAFGCWAQAVSADDARSLGVDILIGNRMKGSVLESIDGWFESNGRFLERRTDVAVSGLWDELLLDRPRIHTRAFIKIQDGCDRRCSYCAVPSLRGAQVSRDPEDICREIGCVVSNGAAEVVLTGVHLGGYRCGGETLAALVRRISSIGGVKRLRFGSLEPFAVNAELLRALAESGIFCRHLHLPVQSGDDSILASMRRGYSSSDFARIVDLTRSILGSDVHISTDLIVGFPGEGDAEFRRSLSLLDVLEVGRVHVFPYSARRGAEAASMRGAVSRNVIRERASEAAALSRTLLSSYASGHLNRADSILVEKSGGGVSSGWSGHYLKVYAADDQSTKNGLSGNVLEVCPEREVGGILLCKGVDARIISDAADEQI